MACQVDLRGAVLDGKRGEFTGKSKPTGNRRGFLSVSDSAPRSRPKEKVDAEAQPQQDVDMDGVSGDAEQVCTSHANPHRYRAAHALACDSFLFAFLFFSVGGEGFWVFFKHVYIFLPPPLHSTGLRGKKEFTISDTNSIVIKIRVNHCLE